MTGWNGMRPRNFRGQFIPWDRRRNFFTRAEDRLMLRLWRAGNDTLSMTEVLARPESDIANHLPHVLAASREEAEWDQAATA